MSTSTNWRSIAFALSLLLIFVIPWEGVELGRLGRLAKPVGLLAAAMWIVSVVAAGRLREPRPFQIVLLVFVLWNAASVLWSASPSETAEQATTWAQLLVFALMLWDLYTTRAALLAGLQAYVFGAYVALASALSNMFAGAAFYTNYSRFSAGDTNPDGFGFVLALGVPVAWYLGGTQRTTRIGNLLRLTNYAYVPAAFLGISLSGTRTALVATVPAVAFGVGSLARLPPKARIAILVFLASSILALLPTVQSLTSFQRFNTTMSEVTEGDLNSRTEIWRDGFASFTKHPVTGIGSNMYRSVNRLGKVAHNSYISVLVEVGLIGFALFASILVIAILQALAQPPWDKSFWLSLLAVWAIGASTLTWEHRKSTWLFLSLVVASAALKPRQEQALSVAPFR